MVLEEAGEVFGVIWGVAVGAKAAAVSADLGEEGAGAGDRGEIGR
jgi:hypothetical protein